MNIKSIILSFRILLLPFRAYARNLKIQSHFMREIVDLAAISIFLFLFTFPSFTFAEEKIPVFPTTPVDVYTIYTSLAVFWLVVIGLIVVIKMKLNEIERIQKLGINKDDTEAPMLG